ncbi:hypothetical protein NIES2104_19430 [Leptolyngbya sp. NIES-2104]|nr:hypothetical protein NIES2104_19430 [Leptolyngbya sp. NIES-2104]
MELPYEFVRCDLAQELSSDEAQVLLRILYQGINEKNLN